jgi:hypothetical protein
MPSPRLPRRDGWTWKQSVSTGAVVDEILEKAARQHARAGPDSDRLSASGGTGQLHGRAWF